MKKFKQLIIYMSFGTVATILNIGTFSALTYFINDEHYLLFNAVAWFLSMLFTYLTNRKFVFRSEKSGIKDITKEAVRYFFLRAWTFLLEEFALFYMIEHIELDMFALRVFKNEISGFLMAKAMICSITIILNYFLTKYIIFRKPEKIKVEI